MENTRKLKEGYWTSEDKFERKKEKVQLLTGEERTELLK